MNPSSRGIRNATSRLESVCFSCRRSIQQQRRYASAAAAVATDDSPSILKAEDEPTATTSTSPRPVYRVKAGIILSRPPLLTRDLHPFEKAYYLYQRRMNERLALPFSRYFYYAAGTVGETEWKRKIKVRKVAAREIGPYHAYSEYGWNDETLVGEPYSEMDHQMDALIQDAESTGKQFDMEELGPTMGGADTAEKKMELERPLPRVTEADTKNDQTSLDRMLTRSLYLLIKNADGSWTFPSSLVRQGEGLKRGAERALQDAAGVNMNTWIVSNNPIGHYAYTRQKDLAVGADGVVELGEKVFFMKARIMAGQADLSAATSGQTEFKWLAKEEVQKLVTPMYWSQTENVLAER